MLTEREMNSPDADIFSQMDDEEFCRLEQEAEQTGTASAIKWTMDKFQRCLRKKIFSVTGLCGKAGTG